MKLRKSSTDAGVFAGLHKLVVLAPHPDDETLGCGTLLARAFAGAGAHVICLTDGSASHPQSTQWPPHRLAQRRRAEMEQALAHLGGTPDDLTWLGLPDSKMHLSDPAKIAATLADLITATGARHIFAPAPEDHHIDHKVTAHVARLLREMQPDWTFYSYPVWSRWEDRDFKHRIAHHAPVCLAPAGFAAQKRAALNAHQSQLGAIVRDDPDGFVLPAAFVEAFLTEDELFWEMT